MSIRIGYIRLRKSWKRRGVRHPSESGYGACGCIYPAETLRVVSILTEGSSGSEDHRGTGVGQIKLTS